MIPQRFEELARRLDSSQLIAYTFENKLLRFQLFHLDSSRLYSFLVPTDTVHGRSVSAEPGSAICSIRLINLEQRLDIRHERYFPPGDPKLVLKDARDRVTLAYGRRCIEHRWLLILQADHALLSCLVRDLGEIRWEVE